MTYSSEPGRRENIATDLVEYLVLEIPGPDALSAVGPEILRAVESSTIRILDLVVVCLDEDGVPAEVGHDSVPGLVDLENASSCYGALLSRHDIELVALALRPGRCAVVLVAEDRWAEPLAAAARAAGGNVRAGERIASDRIEAALARMTNDMKEEP